MNNYQTDEAFCLRALDFSESSQVVTLLTRRGGLFGLIAKGSRKTAKGQTAAVNGPVDLLSHGEAVFLPARRGADLATLTAWNPLNHYPRLRNNLNAFYGGQMLCEFTWLLLSPLDPHPDLYEQLAAALERLGGPQGPRALVAYMKFALAATGYQPHLDSCLGCSRPVRPGVAMCFIPSTGGIWCAACAGQAGGGGQPVNARFATRDPICHIDGAILAALARLPAPLQLPADQNRAVTEVLSAQPTPNPKLSHGWRNPDAGGTGVSGLKIQNSTKALLAAARLLMTHARFNTDRALKTFSLAPMAIQITDNHFNYPPSRED